MILKNIKLKNFKLFRDETVVPLSNLNLLTGINGKGKSSILQAFLILKQSIDYDRTTNKVVLNHDDVKLGNFTDVKHNEVRPSEPIELTFSSENFSVKYKLTSISSDPMTAKVTEVEAILSADSAPANLNLHANGATFSISATNLTGTIDTDLIDLFANDIILAREQVLQPWIVAKKQMNFTKIHYVSADRSGPKHYYEDKNLKAFFSVGACGQETVNVLHHIGGEKLNEEFLPNLNDYFHVDIELVGQTINQQAEFWFEKIFNGAKYKIQPINDTNLLIFTVSPDGTTYHKATNVGYGFTYVLPIIVAGLIAKPGETLIVENPEAHLHPSAQHAIAQFLTYVSQKGVQVIIESHSEHILNGLRISVYDDVITNEQLNVLYFTKSEQFFKKIAIDNKGGISDWPTDFFDQSTKDLNYLFGI